MVCVVASTPRAVTLLQVRRAGALEEQSVGLGQSIPEKERHSLCRAHTDPSLSLTLGCRENGAGSVSAPGCVCLMGQHGWKVKERTEN